MVHSQPPAHPFTPITLYPMPIDSIPAPAARKARRRRRPSPDKPHPDFPLFKHKGTDRWCKKVRGKPRYFGKVSTDSEGKASLERWLSDKDYLLAGREPPPPDQNALTVGRLCDRFLVAQNGAPR